MTAQIANRIEIDGEPHPLLTEPANLFLRQLGDIPFRARSTANWCGFTTTWAIRHGGLYFVDLRGTVCRRDPQIDCRPSPWCRVNHCGRCEIAPISLHEITEVPEGGFPATWFTGELRVPAGPLLTYVHAGWASVYEKERMIAIVEGRVASERYLRPEPANYPPYASASLWQRLAALMCSHRFL